MRLENWILSTVIFIGKENSMGDFVPHGTAFLLLMPWGKEHEIQLAVTARHVIDGISGDEFGVRINKAEGGSECLNFSKSRNVNYHNDDSVDLVVFGLPINSKDYDAKWYSLIRENPQAWRDQYGGPAVGEEVAVVGLYTSQYGLTRNAPIVRTGNIAAIPDELVSTGVSYTDGLLIETRSIAGLSGSPVFVPVPTHSRRDGRLIAHPRPDYLPIGILLGHHVVETKQDEISVPEFQYEELINGSVPLVERNTGIGVVAPLEALFEIVESSEFKKAVER